MSKFDAVPAIDKNLANATKCHFLNCLNAGEWAPGEAIPAQSQLCIRFGVSPRALQQTIAELVEENILVRSSNDVIHIADPTQADWRPPAATPTRYADVSNFFSAWSPAKLRKNWPGIAIAVVIALAASYVSGSYGGPQLLYALFFGLAFHFLSQDAKCQPGIEFCSKTLLRTGVALLGARITFTQVASLGITPIMLVVSAVLVTILFGWLLARWLGRPVTEGILSGGAVAICGASAALAISAVLPQTKENEKYTLLTVVSVTTLSTIAMILYPLVVKGLGLNPTDAGIFIGGSIHDVAQVVGAGYLISSHTGDIATFVKLTRVACLVPVVLVLSILFTTRSGTTELKTQPLVPFFLIGFVWIMIANSMGLIGPKVGEWINYASRACLVTAIAALGVKTSFQALASLGWRPIAMLLAETVWLAAFVLVGLAVSG